jgi:hypothetical protein
MKDDLGELLAPFGAREVETAVWIIDWPAGAERQQAQLLGELVRRRGPARLELEEDPAERPAELEPLPGARARFFGARLREQSLPEAFATWLSRQVWLAAWGEALASPLPPWDAATLFATPRSFTGWMAGAGASLAAVAYFDGDSWMLGVR